MPLSFRARSSAASLLLFALLSGCGGGGDTEEPPVPAATTRSISGTIEGLPSGSLTLERDPQTTLVAGGTSFTFTGVPAGAPYDVRVREYPPGIRLHCEVQNGTGTVGASDVTGVRVLCEQRFAVRVVTRGLAAGNTATVLLDAQKPDNALSALTGRSVQESLVVGAGDSQFLSELPAGTVYRLVVTAQPTNPAKKCRVSTVGTDPSGSRQMGDRDPLPETVDCDDVTLTYTAIGVDGTGLQVGLSLPSPAGSDPVLVEQKATPADGTYTFDNVLATGEAYRVSIVTSPTSPDQGCLVENAEGTAATADITNVMVRCGSVEKFWRFDDDLSIALEPPFTTIEPYRWGTAGPELVYEQIKWPTFPAPGLPATLRTEEIYVNLFSPAGTDMAVFSNPSGKTYWIATESSAESGPSKNRSRFTSIRTDWWLRKTTSNARFALELSDIWLDGVVDNGGSDARPTSILNARAEIVLAAYAIPTGSSVPNETPFNLALDVADLVAVRKLDGTVEWDFEVLGDYGAWVPIFGADSFEVDTTGMNAAFGGPARVSLRSPIALEIDTSSLGVGQRFLVRMEARVQARNAYSNESYATAYLRDPASFDPEVPGDAISVTAIEGLEILPPEPLPEGFTRSDDRTPASPCSSSANPRAVLELGGSSYSIQEGDTINRVVTVTRRGSTIGLVTARLTLAPGTATAGADYRERDYVLRFADGVATPRSFIMPIVDDEEFEGSETFELRLQDVSGCAEIGVRDTATVTISDDDTPEPTPTTYTIGGTVSGLAGGELVIDNIGTPALTITSNGAFQFPRTFSTGHVHRIGVVSQPLLPRQACEVRNGEGTITNANVTNVEITCVVLTQASGVDETFGTEGRTWLPDVGTLAEYVDLAAQADGRVLAVAGTQRITRLLADGTPDASFGTVGDGTVTLGGTQPRLYAVAVQSDGRIVVAGSNIGISGRDDFFVARMLPNGALDPTFAGGAGSVLFGFNEFADGAFDVLVQPDGAILLVGVVNGNGLNGADFAVLRVTPDGQRDTAFGVDGWALANIAGGTDVAAVGALLADGRILVAGRVARSGGDAADVGLARFTSGGAIDTAFGSSGAGTTRTLTIDHEDVRDLQVLPDGRILVVGVRLPRAGSNALLLSRYTADGLLDTTFGTAGHAEMPDVMSGYALRVRGDGSILVAGQVNAPGGTHTDYGLLRYSEAGIRDTTFGTAGWLSIDMYGSFDTPGAMLEQSDGKVVVAGRAQNGSRYGLGLTRVIP